MSRSLWSGTAITASTLLVRAACQAGTFLLVARALEPAAYGQFVALVCVGILVAPLVTAGTEYVLVSLVATHRASTASCLGCGVQTLALLAPFGIALAAVYVGLALDLTVATSWVLFLLVSEILLVPLLELCWRAWQANEAMGMAGALRASPALTKLAAAGLLSAGAFESSIANWAGAYALATTLAVLGALWITQQRHGVHFDGAAVVWRRVREAWPFALYSLAERSTNDVDKLLLASLSGPRDAGLYAAAYRLVEVFIMPVMAALMTMNTAIYRAGATTGPELSRLLWRLASGIVVYGLLSAGAIVFGTDLVVPLLGADYAGSETPLAALSLLPLCYGLRVLFGFGLASRGRQLARMLVQCFAATTGLVLCLVAIPRYGLTGAALATLATEVITILVLLALLPGRGVLRGR